MSVTERAERYTWNGMNFDDFEVTEGTGAVLNLEGTDAREAYDCDEEKKLTHEEVKYHEGAKEDRCAKCVRFTPQESGSHGCQVVQKPIAEDGWCELFQQAARSVEDENPDIERRVQLPYGLVVYIENEEGSVRKGPWGETIMRNPYGYIAKTEGVDGDAVDCFLGPDYEMEQTVYVIHQEGPDPEDKLMIGFPSARVAAQAYEQNYHPSPPEFSMDKVLLRDLPQKLEKYEGRRIK